MIATLERAIQSGGSYDPPFANTWLASATCSSVGGVLLKLNSSRPTEIQIKKSNLVVENENVSSSLTIFSLG